ncbi:MAG: hypothetical protein AAFY77_01995 [Pseudomonadota bacterium]
MYFKTISLCAAALAFAVPAQAGMPVDQTITCPVGGEEFTVTVTPSCSEMGRSMSFAPITSCDFITRLPICPGNGLPLYREFSQDEIAHLEGFVSTPDYQRLRQLRPWQRAHGLAQHLGEAGTETSFWLLLRGLWYDPEAFFDGPETLQKFLDEADQERARAGAENVPFLVAIVGYALSAAGRLDDANVRLDQAMRAADVPDFLQDYVEAIRTCQPDMTRDGCRPGDRFEPEGN